MKKVIGKVILLALIAVISIFLGAKSAYALDLNSFEGLEDIPDNSQTTTTTKEAPSAAAQTQETTTSTTSTTETTNTTTTDNSATKAAEKATQSNTIIPQTGSNTWVVYTVGIAVLGIVTFGLYKKTKIF